MGIRTLGRKVIASIQYLFGISIRQIKREARLYSNNVIRVVNYHDIPKGQEHRFIRQIRWMKRRYCFVSLAQFKDFLSGKLRLKQPGILLTFDDGLAGNYDPLLPILVREKLPALFFVCPNKINTEHYMTHNQIAGCIRSGLVSIGSHTMDHVSLGESLGAAEITRQVFESKKCLEELTGEAIDTFCWPFGGNEDYSEPGFKAILEAGYKYSFTCVSSPALPGINPLLVPRTNIQLDWSVAEVAFQLSPAHDSRFVERKTICEVCYQNAMEEYNEKN